MLWVNRYTVNYVEDKYGEDRKSCKEKKKTVMLLAEV